MKRCGRLLGGVALFATAVQAQDTASGRLLQVDVAPGLRYTSDSLDGDDLSAVTDIGLRYGTATKASVLEASVNGQVALTSDETRDIINDPSVRLVYARESRDTALNTSVQYRRVDLGDALAPVVTSFFFRPQAEESFLTIDAGTRADLNASVNLVFGRDALLGGSLTYGYDRTDYENTADSDLRDSVTQGLDGQLTFRIDPRITARIDASQRVRDEVDGGLDQTEQSLDLGADLAVTPLLNADVTLGYDRVTQDGPEDDVDRDGISAGLSLTREMPNGTLSADANTRIDTAGRRTSVRVGRDLAFDKVTTLGFSLGVSQQDNFGVDPLYGLTLSREFKRATVNASVDQSFATNDDGDTVRNTGATLSLTQALTRRSGLRTSLGLRDQQTLGGDQQDLRRFDLSASYDQALTRDWSAVASYAHSITIEDGAEDRSADTVFVGLQRSFDWRP